MKRRRVSENKVKNVNVIEMKLTTADQIEGKLTNKEYVQGVVDVVKHLSPDQLEAVKQIGFGGILEMKCNFIDGHFCRWFVDRFDLRTCSLDVHGSKKNITPLDVKRILGLNCHGREILESSLIYNQQNDNYWTRLFQGQPITMSSLKHKLINAQLHINDFKLVFTVYLLGVLLCPTTNSRVKAGYINICTDVEEIKSINWGKLVVDHLVNAVRKVIIDHQNGFSASLYFLQMLYLDHVRTMSQRHRELVIGMIQS